MPAASGKFQYYYFKDYKFGIRPVADQQNVSGWYKYEDILASLFWTWPHRGHHPDTTCSGVSVAPGTLQLIINYYVKAEKRDRGS